MALLRVLLVALFAVTLSMQQDYCGDVNADTLQLSVVVFRHGDRTPYTTYPTDPYQINTWMPWGGWGQLTQVGMEQHYLFGKWFRQCYKSFLNDTYSPKDLYVRSTDYDRTLESVEAHLAGAYPAQGFQQWSEDEPLAKLWQPIPIHTIPQSEDYTLITDIKCPPYNQMIDYAWTHAPIIKEIQIINQEMLDYTSQHAGLGEVGDLRTVSDQMCDAVHVERLKNLTLPEWMTDDIANKLDLWKDIWIIVELATDDMVRYAAGQLVSNLQDLLVNKTKHKVPQKHYIYSAHDTTVGSLLAAYGDFNKKGPPYRSAIITELHLDPQANRYFVKVFYRNDTEKDPVPLRIRNCTEKCWLEDYITQLAPVTLKDKKTACYSQPPINGLDESAIIAIAVTSTLVITLVIATVVFLMLPLCKKRGEVPHEELVNN